MCLLKKIIENDKLDKTYSGGILERIWSGK